MEFPQKVLSYILFSPPYDEDHIGPPSNDRGMDPIPVVHTIEDAVKILSSLSQDPIQPITIFRGLNLLAVFLADRVEGIGINDACLHEVNLLPEFNPLGTVTSPWADR